MPADDGRIHVVDFYRGRSLLVTGGSGFMGKVLVEKLMFACPDIGNIFIMMRPKRGKTVESRVDTMFKLPMFDRLRKANPAAFKKLVVLEGDMAQEELGLRPEDRARLHKEVSVVFHCAATLKLEANLKDAADMNLTGTWRIIELCRGMKQLKAFVHLSTIFCHCDIEVLGERSYEPPVNPQDIMQCTRWMDEATLAQITPRLMGPHPNTYTFTKRLAEKLVFDEFPNMPMAIARPAIVTAAYEEPCEGWVDNLNGPTGILVGAGKGVIRTMYCFGEYKAEMIPADHAISALITIGAKTGSAREKPAEIPVYNLTITKVKSLNWSQILDIGRRLVYQFPFEMMAWYPGGNIHSNYYYHQFLVIFLHFIPAYFVDFLMVIFFQKRFLVRIQWRIYEGLKLLQYFTTRLWKFETDKFLALRDEMSDRDKEVFPMKFEEIDNVDYILKIVMGSRQYCLKEDVANIPRCRRNLKILWVVDVLWSIFFWGMLLWFVYSYSETVRYGLDAVGSCLKDVPVLRRLVDRADAPLPHRTTHQ